MGSARTSLAVTILGTLFVLIVSCGEDATLKYGDRDQIVPMAVGTKWIYRTTVTDAAADTTIAVDMDTIRVIKDTTMNGQQWFITSPGDQAWAEFDDGYWIWPRNANPPSDPYLFAKHPADLGEKYLVQFGGATDTITVVDVMAFVRVPLGLFETTHYQITDSTGEIVSESYFTPGLGLVKDRMILHFGSDSTRFHIRELVKFATP
jgi:hypothetical protein